MYLKKVSFGKEVSTKSFVKNFKVLPPFCAIYFNFLMRLHLDALPTFRREDMWMEDADHTEMISEYEPSDMAEMKKMKVKGFTPSKIKPLNAVMKKHVVETIKRDDGTGHRLGNFFANFES